MPKITRRTCLDRTKEVLKIDWGLKKLPLGKKTLRDKPPKGLFQNDASIGGVAESMNKKFSDVGGKVDPPTLRKAKTVSDISAIMWGKVPKKNKMP